MIKAISGNEPPIVFAPTPLKREHRLWLLPNALCLDAPAVAAIWLLLFANCFHLAVSVTSFAALFCTVWMIYLIDRFVDSFSLSLEMPRSARQTFCARVRALWIILIFVVGLLDAAILCFLLDRVVLLRGMLLGSVVAAYLAINWSWSRIWTLVPIKELIIGSLFSAGTLLALTAPSSALPVSVLIAGILFAALCSVNCLSIADWERELDRIQNKHSIATGLGGVITPLRSHLIAGLAFASLVFTIVDHEAWPLALCIAISSIALIALDNISLLRDERSALADLVLLTPAIFLAIRSLL